MEAIFDDVRTRLAQRIEAQVQVSGRFNDGIKTKFFNILEAGRRQTAGVNHITGEVHFLNLLMDRRRVVLTIHDCRFMERKAGSFWQSRLIKHLYLDWPVAQARFVTTVSEATKRDIIRYTGCQPEKVVVIPVAVHDRYQPKPQPFDEQRPRLLQIGTGENKNLDRLVEALRGLPCRLTIIGRLSERQRTLLDTAGIDYENNYNLTDEEMVRAYEDCDIVSFVSTFEGFGMPIIEANAVERVVLTSNCSSMPEVAADAALLVDPFDPAAIRSGVERLTTDAALRERLLGNGRRNRQRFSPAAIAERYYELYARVLREQA